MPETKPTVLSYSCPRCGEPVVLAQSLSAGASMYVRRQSVLCENCSQLVVATGALVQGEAQPVATEIIPLAGGDSGGLDALLLG